MENDVEVEVGTSALSRLMVLARDLEDSTNHNRSSSGSLQCLRNTNSTQLESGVILLFL